MIAEPDSHLKRGSHARALFFGSQGKLPRCARFGRAGNRCPTRVLRKTLATKLSHALLICAFQMLRGGLVIFRVVDVDDSPLPDLFAIDLRFDAAGRHV